MEKYILQKLSGNARSVAGFLLPPNFELGRMTSQKHYPAAKYSLKVSFRIEFWVSFGKNFLSVLSTLEVNTIGEDKKVSFLERPSSLRQSIFPSKP